MFQKICVLEYDINFGWYVKAVTKFTFAQGMRGWTEDKLQDDDKTIYVNICMSK